MRHTISWLGFRYLFDATLGAASPIIGLTRRPAKAPKVRRLTSIDADEARLHGDLDNYMVYHVDVLVGTPGQMQSLIADTGSSITAFPCTDCGKNCGEHMDPPYDPSAFAGWRSCQRLDALA
eukprot:TRINITY_DN24614_c0_g1_i3.p1 TRINITY_DN24614_c0_g1~~TRINITY_DN24614_c0_g1_i3.p1  ORF type:complete len:122 (-),score=7.56 TRINITY_DN24614_c0_g1_i3:196-561(-)